MNKSLSEAGAPRSAIWRRQGEAIAREAHAGQRDKFEDVDYIRHVERVVALVEGDEAKTVAWLHDVVEDNPEWTFDRLENEGIPRHLIRAVSMLTRRQPYAYADYIDDIATDGNPLAITVKLADLRDHLREEGWNYLTAGMIKRYTLAFLKLDTALRACAEAPTTEADGEDYEQPQRTLDIIARMLGWMNTPPRRVFEQEINALKSRLRAEAPATDKGHEEEDTRRGTPEMLGELQSSASQNEVVSAPAPAEDTARFHERVDLEIAALEALSDLPPSLVPAVRAARRLMRDGPTRDYDMPEPVDAHAAAMLTASLQHFLTERTMHAAWRKRAEEAEALAPPEPAPMTEKVNDDHARGGSQ